MFEDGWVFASMGCSVPAAARRWLRSPRGRAALCLFSTWLFTASSQPWCSDRGQHYLPSVSLASQAAKNTVSLMYTNKKRNIEYRSNSRGGSGQIRGPGLLDRQFLGNQPTTADLFFFTEETPTEKRWGSPAVQEARVGDFLTARGCSLNRSDDEVKIQYLTPNGHPLLPAHPSLAYRRCTRYSSHHHPNPASVFCRPLSHSVTKDIHPGYTRYTPNCTPERDCSVNKNLMLFGSSLRAVREVRSKRGHMFDRKRTHTHT
ncbi:hypothetical protein B0T21DRAFT_24027 [Apiosordaria backusii]|uniref:Uncharacterized protein n=1 Tax=Apiosordaria backusii TaxID=314023 RepID=A0AA40EZP9_9PEZI|nr:hypothetical protein B0T21DRAFT_24027 [Apiosordaria backusii]